MEKLSRVAMIKGVEEDMPENYEKLLKDKAYLEFALNRLVPLSAGGRSKKGFLEQPQG